MLPPLCGIHTFRVGVLQLVTGLASKSCGGLWCGTVRGFVRRDLSPWGRTSLCTVEIKLHCANPTQHFLRSVMRPIGLSEEYCCSPSRGGLPRLYLSEPRPTSLSTSWSWSTGDGCHVGWEPPYWAMVLWVPHTWGHVLLGTCRRCFLASVTSVAGQGKSHPGHVPCGACGLCLAMSPAAPWVCETNTLHRHSRQQPGGFCCIPQNLLDVWVHVTPGESLGPHEHWHGGSRDCCVLQRSKGSGTGLGATCPWAWE